eukprot:scaffold301307_cov29-Tisochrysis_lutea.AAC.3
MHHGGKLSLEPGGGASRLAKRLLELAKEVGVDNRPAATWSCSGHRQRVPHELVNQLRVVRVLEAGP